MLDYFVKIFPGEAPYSYLMRLKENLGYNDTDFASLILNKRKISQQIILGQLDFEHFRNTFRYLNKTNLENWVNSNTLLSYCKNFANKRYFEWDILNNSKFTKKHNYLLHFNGRPVIKFCKDCYLENYKKFNNYFLLKKNQLPAVFICLKHKKPLYYVDIYKTSNSVEAIQISEILQAPRLKQFNLTNINFFSELASNSTDLYENPAQLENIRDYYLNLYYLEETNRADFKSLSLNLKTYFGDFLDEINILVGNINIEEDMLNKEFVPYKNFYNPILCLLVHQLNKIYHANDLLPPDCQKYLLPKTDICINNICLNYKETTANLIKINPSPQKDVTGVYKCNECLMTYSKYYYNGNMIAPPEVINYGSPFITKLNILIENGSSPKEISKLFGLLENTILKLMKSLNPENPELDKYLEKHRELIKCRETLDYLFLTNDPINLDLFFKKHHRELNYVKNHDEDFYNELISLRDKKKDKYFLLQDNYFGKYGLLYRIFDRLI